MIKDIAFSITLFCLGLGSLSGQSESYSFDINTSGGYSSDSSLPFWFRSGQNGSIPLSGASFSLEGAFRKPLDRESERKFDWGGSVEGRINLGHKREFILVESYGQVRLGIFQMKAGRSRDQMGLVDTTLSSGAWAFSGNSLGIPSVELSVPEFWSLPFLGGFFAIKGNYSHGWMGKSIMKKGGSDGDTVLLKTYFHQKSLYGRIGRPESMLRVYLGLNHQVTWVDGNSFYDYDFSMSMSEIYYYVVTAKKYNSGRISGERLGNHLGSVDLAVEFSSGDLGFLLYRQQIYETDALAYLANIQDGLNGIALSNLRERTGAASWHKLVFEFLYTKNQGGPPWAPTSPSGAESYYNHGQFVQGWTYNGIVMGSPFLTSRVYALEGLPDNPSQYFVNNRLYALHLGLAGNILGMDCLVKSSWSRNTGTYWTSEEAFEAGIPEALEYGVFHNRDQFSAYGSLTRKLKGGLSLGIIGAFDYGELLDNSYGLYLRLSYSAWL